MKDSGKSRGSVPLRRFVVGSSIVVGCGWLCGCFQFVQADPSAVPAGARIRAELTSEGSRRVAEVMGGEEERRVDGRVIEASPSGSMVLEVISESRAAPVGVSSRPLFGRVSLSGGDLVRVELRELSRGRTAFLVGGAVAVATVVVTAAFDIGEGSDANDDGPDVDQIRIPLFSFPIGR